MTVRGIDDVRRQITSARQRVKTGVSTAASENGDRMVGLAKALAPRDKGKLVDSIRKEPGASPKTVLVKAGGELTTEPSAGGEFDYAPRTEHGGGREDAHPYFWPAARALAKPMAEHTARAVRKATEGGGRE